MDKKQQQQQYSRQGSSKALSSDSRKSSELYSNKPWPKNSRRRENPNSAASKNDSQRSSNFGPAKTRPNVDKRPKPRGGASGYSSGQPPSYEDVSAAGAGLAVDENSFLEISDSGRPDHFEFELNSVYAPGSKKQNLNHLLNFHYSPRETDNYGGLNVFGKNGNNRQHAKKHKYNKEQFLQANFQFVVNWKARPIITSSPDTLIAWDLIEQINIQTTEEPQCPICLYPPVAAKLTRCGHVYCWPCLLHYLALSDKTWRKCPICYEAVHINDLKSTTIVQQENFNVGNYISLHLMQRKKGSLFIEKYSGNNTLGEELPLYSTNDDATKFAKFLVANRSDVLSIIEREQLELATCNTEPNCPEFVFTQQALDLLKEREIEIKKEIDLNPKERNSVGEKDASELVNEDGEQNAKYYYFYQSLDGQNIFLHPLNVKMLQACYGSLNRAPPVIDAKILQKEHHSMDEDHRRKFTCLGHLPLTCQFAVVELQLETPVVSEEVLKLFKDDILQRKQARLRRDREEKRREVKINAINDRQMGKLLSSAANINLSSSHEFPTCGFEETLSSSPNELYTSPIEIPSTSNRNTYSSVANSLGKLSGDFPSIESNWGKVSAPNRPRMLSGRYSESESLNESVAEFDFDLGDVLAEAISKKGQKVNKNENTAGKKKTKKNKKMLPVFSTGMNFNGK